MSEKNYPPLPAAAWRASTIRTTEDAYTEAQMRVYVDADRAQRLPLTDEQCDAIDAALTGFCTLMSSIDSTWRDVFNTEGYSDLRALLERRRNEVIRAACGHVVNKGETNV